MDNKNKSKNELTNKIAIFKNETGDIKVSVKLYEETVWLNLNQLVELFDRDKSVISRHIRNIFKEQELEEDSVVAKFATTASDTKTYNVDHYNLDMIISVGYRVNSKQATQFRKWATGVLKGYLIKGYSINREKVLHSELQNLQNTVRLLSNTLINQGLVNDTGSEVIQLIQNYAKSWELLLKYDEDKLEFPKSEQLNYSGRVLKYEQAKEAINSLKSELVAKGEASTLFGLERDKSLGGIIGNIYQTFGGVDLYPSLEEKAAHLIYFSIKDHPFSDGNKRIGSFLFLWFLQANNMDSCNITPESLTAMALLIAESQPENKEIIIKLVVNLLHK